MTVPAHSLRVVFALSTLASSVILVLFVRGRATGTPEFWLQLFAAAAGICAVICFVAFRKGKLRLVGVPLPRFARIFVRQLVLVYIASSVAVTAVALAIIYAVTRSAPDSLALAVLAGLWLSLWLAPGMACITTWRNLRSAGSNDA